MRTIIAMTMIVNYIGDEVPNVEIDGVFLEPTRVVIHLHINEYIYPLGVGTWVTNQSYKNLLRIDLVQTSIKDGLLSSSLVKKIYASDHYPRDLSKITAKRKRQKLQQIGFKIVLEDFDYKGLTSLSFTANTTITERELITKRGFSFAAVNMEPLSGKPSTVEVMKNRNVLSKGVGYFLGESFYNGPKTQLPNGRWVTGTTQTEESRFLTVRSVPNIKVADYRDLYEVLPKIGTPITSAKNNLPYGTKLGYFSELSSCRDKEGNLRFFFTLDYESAYKNKSQYGDLFAKMSQRLKDRVLLNSAIRSLQLSRKRVDLKTTATNEPSEMFVIAGEQRGDAFRKSNAKYGAIREEEFSFQYGDLLLRSFSGADRSLKDITVGKYQYSVSANIEDGMYNFMDFQSRELVQSQALLQTYRNLLNSAKNYDNDSQTYDRDFINDLRAQTSFENLPYIRALITISENITFLADNLSNSEIKRFLSTLRYKLSPRTGTKEGVDQAINIMGIMQRNMATVMEIVSKGAAAILHGRDQTIKTGASRGNLQFSLSSTFSEVFDATESYDKGIAYLSTTEILDLDGATGLKTISGTTLENRMDDENLKFFNAKSVMFTISSGDQSFTADGTGTSFSYLTPTSLRLGKRAYMINTDKNVSYSGDLSVETMSSGDAENKYKMALGELSKSRFKSETLEFIDIRPTSDETFSMESNLDEPNETNPAKESINQFNLSFNTREQGFTNPFTAANISAVYLSSQIDQTPVENLATQAKINNLSPMSRFTNIDSEHIAGTKVEPKVIDQQYEAPSSVVITTSPDFELNGLDGTKHTISREKFDKLPNHFKAIFASGATFGSAFSKIFDAANLGDNNRYNLILGSIVKVEVLAGYHKDREGDTLIKAPKFIPLTYDYYKTSAGKNLLCRLKPYENDSIGFKRSNMASIYNKFFVVAVPESVAGPENLLQIRINSAETIQEIVDIYDAFGVDFDRGRGAVIDVDPNTCGVLSEERATENIYGSTTPTSGEIALALEGGTPTDY